jgi:glycosyltransferase involved in cell wall biosynthesis
LKAVFLIRSLFRGGTERQLVLLAKELSRAGANVQVAVFYEGGELQKELENARIPIVHLQKRGRWDLIGCLARLVKYVRREKPDVLVSHLTDANVLGALASPFIKPTKLVWEVRASEVPGLRDGDWVARASFALSGGLSRVPDLVVFNSRAGEKYHLNSGYRPRRTVVIHNGFDTSVFRPQPMARERLRTEWGVPAKTCLIGLVGRMDPIKGHELFLNAAGRLAAARSEVRFVLVGDGTGERERQLRALCDSLFLTDKVIWAGPRDDMPAVYSALDILTLSSLAEGFPNAVGEAMACQTPCVVVSVGDAAALVGQAGGVVPPNDAASLCAGWIELMDYSAAEFSAMQTKARERIVQSFGIERLASETMRSLSALS